MGSGRGFTLVELLVVIAVGAILAAMLFVVITKARAKSYQMQCTSNQRQLVSAIQLWAQDNGGYPPADLVWRAVEMPPKLLRCPAAGRATPAYTYNGDLSGHGGDMPGYSSTTYVTADGDDNSYIARHAGKVLVGYEDGHVSLVALDDAP